MSSDNGNAVKISVCLDLLITFKLFLVMKVKNSIYSSKTQTKIAF